MEELDAGERLREAACETVRRVCALHGTRRWGREELGSEGVSTLGVEIAEELAEGAGRWEAERDDGHGKAHRVEGGRAGRGAGRRGWERGDVCAVDVPDAAVHREHGHGVALALGEVFLVNGEHVRGKVCCGIGDLDLDLGGDSVAGVRRGNGDVVEDVEQAEDSMSVIGRQKTIKGHALIPVSRQLVLYVFDRHLLEIFVHEQGFLYGNALVLGASKAPGDGDLHCDFR